LATKKKGLTPAQLEKMRNLLVKRRSRLLDKSRSKLGEVEELGTDAGGDSADRAAVSLDRDIMVDSAARETREIRDIEAALGKIDAGTYGVCDECSQAIPMARLEYMPNAQYCITCQEKLEAQGLVPDETSDEFRIAD
jgi:RNA polymerase-binding protein DksA